MKKTAIIIYLATVMMSQWASANPIGSAQALKNAQAFLQKKGIHAIPGGMKRAPMVNDTGEEAPFYIFNLGNNRGFVIASGDDRATPILGYSDKGSMRTDNLPDNVRCWLDSYKAQIKALKKAGTATVSPRRAPSKVVEPLLTSKWDQGYPFNKTCPLNSKGERCVTGCVATAMAQVMYYHRQHATRQVMADIPGYITKVRDTVDVETVSKGSVIDFDNMLDEYAYNNYTEAQALAVANLMLYCGVSVKMKYGAAESGAYYDASVFSKYFDYDDDVRVESRDDYTDAQWESMIYGELAKGNPICYDGHPSGSMGHAFVVDGCDADGYVHVNWGWGGENDGYFQLTSSYVYEILDGYSYGQEAVLGAVPNGSFPRLTTQSITLKSADVVEGLSSRTSIPVLFNMTVANLTDTQNSFEHAIGLYKNGQLKSIVANLSNISNLAVNGKNSVSVSLNLDATLGNGVYQLRPISRSAGADKWRWNGNYDQMLTLVVHNDQAKITVGIPPTEGTIITFADAVTKGLCVENWDSNGDGELSQQEAAAVTSLNGVFRNNYDITSFDELKYFTGLKKIENSAFRFCLNLGTVTLPQNLVAIEGNAFYYSGLQNITIPASVREIGSDALLSNKLQDIQVEAGNKYYDTRGNCHALIKTATNTLVRGTTSTIIPKSVTAIGDGAFASLYDIAAITIPEGVKSIGRRAFDNCDKLPSVNIPKSVTSIGDSAFYYCTALTSISIPKNVRTLSSSAFSCCWNVSSIQVDANNPYYDSRNGCNAVMEKATNKLVKGCKSTVIPEETKVIGDYAFDGCSDLPKVSIPPHVTEIGKYAFDGCKNFIRIELPEGLRTIGERAFYCPNLTTLILPSTVTSIGSHAFISCDNLACVEARMENPVDIEENTFSPFIDATLYVPQGCASRYRSMNYSKDFYKIVEGSIPYRDIIDFADLNTKNICIENWDKDGDKELTKEEAAAVTKLGNVFTKPVSDIPYEDMESDDEYGIHSFDELQYFTGLTAIDYEEFQYCENLKSLKLPPNLKEIRNRAFQGCGKLQSLNIPQSVTKIGNLAFIDCRSLKSLVIPNGVTEIEYGTFEYCTDLVSISLPDNLQSLGNDAFSNCESLASIHIPTGISVIKNWTFKYCKNLEYVIIPENIQKTGKEAFDHCSKLKSVSIPSQVGQIDEKTFNKCDNLTAVEVKRTEPLAINNNTFTNYTGATLYVPKGSRSAYMAADNWKLFGNIVELTGIRGDVNNDGNVTVTDVGMLVDAILGLSQGIPLTPADMNEDGLITVVDVMSIVNQILTQ